MKFKHTKYFLVFYAVVMLLLGTPLINIANKPVLVLGMPMLLTWVSFLTLMSTIALLIQYNMDIRAKQKTKEKS